MDLLFRLFNLLSLLLLHARIVYEKGMQAKTAELKLKSHEEGKGGLQSP